MSNEDTIRNTDITLKIKDEKIYQKILDNFPKAKAVLNKETHPYEKICDCLKLKIKDSAIISVVPMTESVRRMHRWAFSHI